MTRGRIAIVTALASAMLLTAALPSGATHRWGKYHWAASANPRVVKLVDSMASGWTNELNTVSADWTASDVVDMPVESGADDDATRRDCPAVSGKVRVCNYDYGNTGWLGVAEIWILRGKDGHIAQGRAKMNEFYDEMRSNADARLHVACQEIGHTLGLDHQRDPSSNSCMDDVDGRWDPNFDHPNAHDYEELGIIYAHLDTSKKPGPPFAGSAASDRSVQVRQDGAYTVITFIFWA